MTFPFPLLLFSLMTFTPHSASYPSRPPIDVQGHRGCRGLMPENTLPAFLKALELGVTTLEMDAVITKDHRVVLSHEPFLSHEICLTAEGHNITETTEKQYNPRQMPQGFGKSSQLVVSLGEVFGLGQSHLLLSSLSQ